MASVPLKGDRITAKVDLTVYTDKECAKPFPWLPPGPNGLRSTLQKPGERKLGEVVGTYTGNSSESGFEVDFTLKYDVAVKKLFGWDYQTVTKPVLLWVKKDQVTGFWDKGVDAPKLPDKLVAPGDQSSDNTNLFLGLAVGAAALWKFKKGSN
jgi:hypothetical protein